MEPYVCLLMGCVMERQTVRMVLTKDFAVVSGSVTEAVTAAITAMMPQWAVYAIVPAICIYNQTK
jgi:hypothetical protein